jgi:hypothetical protein
MRGCELLSSSPTKSVADTTGDFIRERAAGIVDEWIGLIAPVYALLPEQIPEIRQVCTMPSYAGLHTSKSHDIETYVYLREHADMVLFPTRPLPLSIRADENPPPYR